MLAPWSLPVLPLARLARGRRGLVEEDAVHVPLALHALRPVATGGTRAHAPRLLPLQPPHSLRGHARERPSRHRHDVSMPYFLPGGSALGNYPLRCERNSPLSTESAGGCRVSRETLDDDANDVEEDGRRVAGLCQARVVVITPRDERRPSSSLL